MFKEKYPGAWTFHYRTCRSELNTLQLQHADSMQESYKEYLSAATVLLPEVKIPPAKFADLLFERYSCRRFKNEPLDLQDVVNILFAGYGKCNTLVLGNNEFIERTVPSGGGLYPLELYLIAMNITGLEPGIYHYVITPGLLEVIKKVKLPKYFLENLFMQQPYVADASMIIVATSVIERTMKKYFDRGYRYILFEAGHSFQNMNLMAATCKLGSMNIGGFFDADMCQVLGVDIEEEVPLYAMAVGVPDGNSITARIPA
jgi:SagB-type dehydrogenase family enzyme